MTGLDPCTIAEAGPVMARAVGLSWTADRPEVLHHINKYRLLLYTMYDKIKLFDDVYHCIKVSQFPQICARCCECTYSGVTLPSDITSVVGMWEHGRPLTLHSRWREAHTGQGIRGPRISSIEMAETFPTERDITKIAAIQIFTEREEDHDKKVYVDVIDSADRKKRITFTLIQDGWAVSAIKIKKIIAVSLPPERIGTVTIAQQGGHTLSVYAPWETVPNYRRFKIADRCRSGVVLIQGVKRFQNICFDHDIVEVGNALVIESAGKFFKYGDITTEAKEIKRAEYDKSEMAGYMQGLIARHRGGAIQDGSPFKGPTVNLRKPLPGYDKRNRRR